MEGGGTGETMSSAQTLLSAQESSDEHGLEMFWTTGWLLKLLCGLRTFRNGVK